MKSRTTPLVQLVALVCTFTFFATNAALAQKTQKATTPLTDDQAQELLQRISSAPGSSRPATALEIRKLLAYVENQPQPAAAAAAAPASASPASSGENKEKMTRIGIVMPNADLGSGFQGASVGEPLRMMLSQYLAGPGTQLIPIDAMVPQQIDAEAQQKHCDYLLYSALTQKKPSHTGFLSRATGMANMVPMVGMTRAMSSMAAAAAAANAAQQVNLAQAVKAKNELTLEYKLAAPGNAAPVLSDAVKTKATADGQDVITPMIQQAATSIMAQVTKK